MKIKSIQFKKSAIYALAQKIFAAERCRQTDIDEMYFDDLSPEESGLPCFELRICPFGVFLTGNCELPESLELWAKGYNPNCEDNPQKLARKILHDFGTLDHVCHFHLDHFPVEGMTFELSHTVGTTGLATASTAYRYSLKPSHADPTTSQIHRTPHQASCFCSVVSFIV